MKDKMFIGARLNRVTNANHGEIIDFFYENKHAKLGFENQTDFIVTAVLDKIKSLQNPQPVQQTMLETAATVPTPPVDPNTPQNLAAIQRVEADPIDLGNLSMPPINLGQTSQAPMALPSGKEMKKLIQGYS